MKKFFSLLLVCVIIFIQSIAAQQGNNAVENKMSTVLVNKFREFQKNSSVKRVSAAEYKNMYNSRFIPVDKTGRMFLNITAIKNLDAISNTIISWGGEIHNKGKINIYAWVPIDKLPDLLALDGITFIDGPGYSYSKSGAVNSADIKNLFFDRLLKQERI